MAAGYSKEFLIDAFVSRYACLGTERCSELRLMAETFYDEVGKDKFRVYASLDAAAIKEYKASVV
jgi:hypothetical protein